MIKIMIWKGNVMRRKQYRRGNNALALISKHGNLLSNSPLVSGAAPNTPDYL